MSARCFQGHTRLGTYKQELLALGRLARPSVTQCSLQLEGKEGISNMNREWDVGTERNEMNAEVCQVVLNRKQTKETQKNWEVVTEERQVTEVLYGFS